MPKKSRNPNTFNCSDYNSWYLEIIDIRERLMATGEWPMHLDTDFVTLRNEQIEVQTDYEDKKTISRENRDTVLVLSNA